MPDGVRKTFKYRLMPTPEQERTLEVVLWRCRTLYNVALEQRRTWWARGQGVGATYYQQKRELPDLKAACPDSIYVFRVFLMVPLRADNLMHGRTPAIHKRAGSQETRSPS